MKTIKIATLFLLIGLSFASCDFLDKEPTKLTPETFFKNESEAKSFLTGVYATMLQASFYGDSYLYIAGGDDLSHYGGPGRNPNTQGLICNNANSSDPLISKLWYVLYSGINRANMFIESVDKTPNMDDKIKNGYKAEARTLRAFYYFTLVQGWGDVPFKTSSTQSVEGVSIPRTNKEIIYDFIVTELDEAANDLKTAKELAYQPGHVSKSAAWGLLARVYLFRAGEHFRDNKAGDATKIQEYFKQASAFGQKVMSQGHALADNYWDVFIDLCSDKYNSTGKNESIWEVEFAGSRTTDVRAEGRIGNTIGIQGPDLSATSLTGKEDPGFGYAFIYCTPKLYDMYVANGDINRMNWNISPFSYVQATTGSKPVIGRNFEYGKKAEVKKQYFDVSYSYGDGDVEKKEEESAKNVARACAKYRREYETATKRSKNDTSINFPLMRYSDVLLMIAEAENEINAAPTTLAYECINTVRRRAGISELENLNKESFRQAVKDERAMELCFEFTRHFDLIRWGEFVKNMNELAPIALSGDRWTQGPTNVHNYFRIASTYNYFPIPSSEIAVNKDITENNPGW